MQRGKKRLMRCCVAYSQLAGEKSMGGPEIIREIRNQLGNQKSSSNQKSEIALKIRNQAADLKSEIVGEIRNRRLPPFLGHCVSSYEHILCAVSAACWMKKAQTNAIVYGLRRLVALMTIRTNRCNGKVCSRLERSCGLA